jgi:TP901 family phage tail tape measure protein
MTDNLAISVPIRGDDQLSPTLRQAIASLGGFDQAAQQSDAARLASTERTLAAQVRAAEQAAREQVRLAQDLAREQQRIAADQARATLTQARQSVQSAPGPLTRQAAQEQLRAAQDLAREQQRLATDTGRVQVRAAQDAARQQIQAAREAARETGALRGVGAAAGGIARGALSETVGGGLLLASGLGVAAGAAEATRLVVGFGRESVQSFSSFERAMRETNALLGQTGAVSETTFRQMSRDVLDFSSRVGVDAVGASRALYQTISAGVPQGADAMHVLDAAAKASIGGFTQQEVAVDGLTSVLNAYHARISEVDRINSQMFQTVNLGKITYSALAAGIGQVVPIAAAMGVSFAEVGAIIANSTAQGVTAGQTFDGLRQVLQAIIRPSQEARDTARLYGLEFNETAARAQGLLPFLEGVTRTVGGNHTAMAALFGDVNALNIVLANTGPNAAIAAAGFDKITASTTAADDAAAQVDKSTSRHLETATARWKRFQIEVGQTLAETAGTIVKFSDDITAAAQREHQDPATRGGSTLQVPALLRPLLTPPPADADDPTGRIRRQQEALRAEYSRGKITLDEYRESVRQPLERASKTRPAAKTSRGAAHRPVPFWRPRQRVWPRGLPRRARRTRPASPASNWSMHERTRQRRHSAQRRMRRTRSKSQRGSASEASRRSRSPPSQPSRASPACVTGSPRTSTPYNSSCRRPWRASKNWSGRLAPRRRASAAST